MPAIDLGGCYIQKENTPVTQETCKEKESILKDDRLNTITVPSKTEQSANWLQNACKLAPWLVKKSIVTESSKATLVEDQLQDRCFAKQSSVVKESCVVEGGALRENDGSEHDINIVEAECLIEEGRGSFDVIYPPSTEITGPENSTAGDGLCLVVDATKGTSTIIHQWLTEKDVDYVIEHVLDED